MPYAFNLNHIPWWVIAIVACVLGIGTMVWWKRIVKTIGEKIGKHHMTYAQGGVAEIVAAWTIALSTFAWLPVSTTHVLSSGVAGSMAATWGTKELQMWTLKHIALARVLTLPATIIMWYFFYFIAVRYVG
jgi:PiT family inorganic phosphate transporter